MSSADTLHGFAYGEHLDSMSQRSLGYSLLAPPAPAAWSTEVENLARALQATPYPDYWVPAELFCSVLLATGQRLVAVVRYGLADNTPSKRRGGLELIGVIGPAGLDPASALTVYRWLRQRRTQAEDLRSLSGQHSLAQVLASAPPAAAPESPQALPAHGWQNGTLMFAAASPLAPDQALGLLQQAPSANWQWLPLCGSDFSWQTYTGRGPLIGWEPQLLDMAVKLERPAPAGPLSHAPSNRWPTAALAVLLVLLLGANLWALWSLPGRVSKSAAPSETRADPVQPSPPSVAGSGGEEGREKFGLALHRLLREEDGASELTQAENQLIARYQALVQQHQDLRVDNKKAQAAVGLVSLLGRSSADRVARVIQDEFKENKGYDPELIKLVSQRVRERLLAEAAKAP